MVEIIGFGVLGVVLLSMALLMLSWLVKYWKELVALAVVVIIVGVIGSLLF